MIIMLKMIFSMSISIEYTKFS